MMREMDTPTPALCLEAEGQIHEYLNGTLDPSGDAALASHLGACQECRWRLILLRVGEHQQGQETLIIPS